MKQGKFILAVFIFSIQIVNAQFPDLKNKKWAININSDMQMTSLSEVTTGSTGNIRLFLFNATGSEVRETTESQPNNERKWSCVINGTNFTLSSNGINWVFIFSNMVGAKLMYKLSLNYSGRNDFQNLFSGNTYQDRRFKKLNPVTELVVLGKSCFYSFTGQIDEGDASNTTVTALYAINNKRLYFLPLIKKTPSGNLLPVTKSYDNAMVIKDPFMLKTYLQQYGDKYNEL